MYLVMIVMLLVGGGGGYGAVPGIGGVNVVLGHVNKVKIYEL